MKHLTCVILLLVLAVGCGEKQERKSIEKLIEKKDIAGLKEKQSELQEEYNAVSEKMTEVNRALDELQGVKELPVVTTIAVQDTIFEHTIEVQGSVDTKNNTMLFSEFSGVLTRLYVKKGQRVSRGQLIAKVDDGGLSQQLGQMEVQYELAKTTFERQARLWEKKIGSEIQYLQAKTQMEAAGKAVKQIKAQLAKTTIKAPFTGIIDDVPVKQGAVVIPGQTPIARLVNLNDMYVRAEVSERYLGNIKVGTPVQIVFPAIRKEVTGKIRQVGNFINPNNRTFYIEIGVKNKENIIKPNLMATLKIADYRNEKALIIPTNIVQEDGEGVSFVYTVAEVDGKKIAKKMQVTKGLTQGEFVEITDGLEANTTLINEGSQGIQDGAEIDVK